MTLKIGIPNVKDLWTPQKTMAATSSGENRNGLILEVAVMWNSTDMAII